jgi:arabinogalactan endo-1,4-beta-galactosidase
LVCDSAYDYINAAVVNVETELDRVGKKLAKKVLTPMTSGYRPELDVTAELNSVRAKSQYQNTIGVLR